MDTTVARGLASDGGRPERRATGRANAAAGRYAMLDRLGSGGMGTVYRVLDRVAGEERVLKRMQQQGGARARFFLESFEREYQVLRTLDHPRIIRVFDYGTDEEGPYYTMELLDGQDMRAAVPMPYKTACSCLRDVATSLVLLHTRRLVHRDLSPGNVRLTGDGRCKLLDFGALSPFGSSSIVVGTAPLVAPEALALAPLDERTDLYSLGALAYWMLTGRHAYPAPRLKALPAAWAVPPPPPSALVKGIPDELDDLVLSLLSRDPRARPTSAAEVIARFTVLGELSPEDATEATRHAMSFLSSPRFVGRAELLGHLEEAMQEASCGRGGAVVVEAIPGLGRSRLLEELGVRAQLAGMAVVRADASTFRRANGTARALALRVFDALPELAAVHSRSFHDALVALGPDLAERLGRTSGKSIPPGADPSHAARALDGWIAAIARDKPLVIQVDNVEHADDASLALLAALANASPALPLLVMTTVAEGRGQEGAIGLGTLLQRSVHQKLRPLTVEEVHELTRTLFGTAPNVQRFAEWLFDWTAGSPLHALEISRQLLARDVIRYTAGVWMLPDRPPEKGLPAALGDALSARVGTLSEGARILAECLALQHEEPTLGLCRLLLPGESAERVLSLLDELAQRDILHAERDGYRFSSAALREAVIAGMDDLDLRENHKRLGDAFLSLAGPQGNPALRLQAGWHLIQGEDEERGADTIASVTHDALTGNLIANLHRVGPALEAALRVYDRYRRSIYERMPLLAALAQAGFYEDREWGDRYGAQALDVLEDLSGLRTARRARRFLGGTLGLVIGILFALVRFRLAPRTERKYSFDKILIQLFTAVTTLTGAAALSLDAKRAACIASVLEPFAVLPERLTPFGIYQYCRGLENIACERQAEAYDTFDLLIRRFADPRYYPSLPDDGRRLYFAGAHFARGAMAIFRADGKGALESADVLDTVGIRLYTMIASQLRWLYYTTRGEFDQAIPHRKLVEEHAADVGSVWQVETWQGASLLVVYPWMNDIVNTMRITEQLETASRTVPSLKPYVRAARASLLLARGDVSDRALWDRACLDDIFLVPRQHVGWAILKAIVARSHSLRDEHEDAKRICEEALEWVTDADRDYAALFTPLELELARADAALGRLEEASARTDALLARFQTCDHGLVLGSIHATKAHIAHAAGDVLAFEQSLADTERWFVPIGALGLIAQCERLRELRDSVGRQPVFSPQLGDENARTEIVNRQVEQSAALTIVDEGGVRPRHKSVAPGR